ncbi:NUDIX hydrolase [Microbacterium sp.]|uniref:NUDIX hydrolase n=1 Tax=Microbacterium sp. TaxID=51671 RepID=UPI003A8B2D84
MAPIDDPTRDPGTGLPIAATVVLLRDASAGLEVLMLERPRTGSFASAWVFPGGKVEDADRRDDADATHRAAAVRETAEETGLRVAERDLVPLSRWTPPVEAPIRIRTWFFVAPAPAGPVSANPHEAVAVRWLRPADALHEHAQGGFALYPPTWVTLYGLAAADRAGAAMAGVRAAGADMFDTVVSPAGVMVWPGDEDHPAGGAPGGRHRLRDDRLPWEYVRDP